jgi:hypothetical protein
MAAELRAIEVTGTVDEAGRLTLDEPLESVAPGRVRLIVLAAERVEAGLADPDERSWLVAAAASPSFAFLADPGEDVYSPEDGTRFVDGHVSAPE